MQTDREMMMTIIVIIEVMVIREKYITLFKSGHFEEGNCMGEGIDWMMGTLMATRGEAEPEQLCG